MQARQVFAHSILPVGWRLYRRTSPELDRLADMFDLCASKSDGDDIRVNKNRKVSSDQPSEVASKVSSNLSSGVSSADFPRLIMNILDKSGIFAEKLVLRIFMNIRLDIHTHTIASGHAFSSLQEMAKAAAEKGLDILGITDHASSLPGAPAPVYFRNLHVVPREMYGVRLILGAELNILDTSGHLDLEPFYYRMMDIRIGGIHSLCWKGGTKEENTNAMVTAIHNPWLQMVTHPGDGTAELEFLPIVLAAKETGTILEINNSSLNPVRKKVKAIDNNLGILRLCKQYEVPVILGSDAHISFAIANYDNIYPLLAETEFPDGLILNDKPEAFLAALKKTPE